MADPSPPAKRAKPGLRSIYDAREGRRPGGKYARPAGSTYLVAVGAIIASLVAYKIVSGHQLDVAKSDLLAKQRAITTTVGTEWYPMRDKLEAMTLDAAKEFKGDFVDSEAARWDFRSSPGIYLRMRAADAKDVESLRRAAAESQRDGFAGCLLREPNAAAARGEPDSGAFAEQPWNLRQAYMATRVLTDEWATQVKEADDPLRLRVFEQQYEKAVKEEIPLAARIIKRAEFYLFVLDEDDERARKESDAGVITEEGLQLVPHEARVHVINLKTGSELVRLRRVGEASFVMAGENAVADPETRSAMQRQVNNCALANLVRAEIDAKGKKAVGTTP
jgi:hypothetical protein